MVLVLQYWPQLDRVPCYDLKYDGSGRAVSGAPSVCWSVEEDGLGY